MNLSATRDGALVIGAGLMGRWHAHALGRLGIPVSGVVDRDEGRAASLASRHGGCSTYASVGEALKGGGSRVAHVCTHVDSHVPMIRQLLDAGLHVLCEKPLTRRSDETRQLLEEAARQDRLLCPVHQFLFQVGFRRAQSVLPTVGRIRHIDAIAVSAGAAGGDAERAEAVVEDILPHPLSMMRRLVGEPFASAVWTPAIRSPGEFRTSGSAGEISLGILVSMHGRPTRNTVRIVCDGGSFHLDMFHGFMVEEAPEVSRMRKIWRPFGLSAASFTHALRNLARRGLAREPAYPGLRSLIERFHQAARSGGTGPIRSEETQDVAETRDRLLETV